MKAPLKKEGTQIISKQYNTNNVSNINNKENNNITVLEQFTGTELIKESYGKLCNIDMVNTTWEKNDHIQYFNCNNIIFPVVYI